MPQPDSKNPSYFPKRLGLPNEPSLLDESCQSQLKNSKEKNKPDNEWLPSLSCLRLSAPSFKSCQKTGKMNPNQLFTPLIQSGDALALGSIAKRGLQDKRESTE